MRKRNGFQKMLSVALALLMAVSLFSVAASAEQTFRYLNTYSDVCQSGEYWFDSYSLAQATGETGYRGALFNISEDNNTIRVMYTPAGGTYTTEYHYRETESAFFAYLHVVPEFVLLPTSPNGLENGAYWFDKADLIDKLKSYYAHGRHARSRLDDRAAVRQRRIQLLRLYAFRARSERQRQRPCV